MAYQLEKAPDPLHNIRKARPILSALRTIALGSWQAARNRMEGLEPYTRQLLDLLPLVVPAVTEAGRPTRIPTPEQDAPPRGAGDQPSPKVALLVVGSERGLCGQYNRVLIDRLQRYLERRDRGVRGPGQIDLLILRSRMIQLLTT